MLELTVLPCFVWATLAALALKVEGTLVLLLSARPGTGPVREGRGYGVPGERRPLGLFLGLLREKADAARMEDGLPCADLTYPVRAA